MKLTFETFQKILSDAGVCPPITILNKIYANVSASLTPPITASAIDECITVWADTLRRLSAARPIMPAERAQIGRLIQANGSESTRLALFGAGFEMKSDSFDPAQHLSVHRVSDPKNFARFASIGAQEKEKLSRKAQPKPQILETPKEEVSIQEMSEKAPMSEEARKILQGLGMIKPKPMTDADINERRRVLEGQLEQIKKEDSLG